MKIVKILPKLLVVGAGKGGKRGEENRAIDRGNKSLKRRTNDVVKDPGRRIYNMLI